MQQQNSRGLDRRRTQVLHWIIIGTKYIYPYNLLQINWVVEINETLIVNLMNLSLKLMPQQPKI